MTSNIAMHLSRPRKVIFFADCSLRPGDGERSKDQFGQFACQGPSHRADGKSDPSDLSCVYEGGVCLSPTVFREGRFRFFFFSREESRKHIHVSHPDGEAKFWLESTIELARNIVLSSSKMNEVECLITSRKMETTDAWNNHFGG